ncbi:MAG: cyclodeaminase/cyclohydrolase family protein [Candidatus Firestonebacteria bacterium]
MRYIDEPLKKFTEDLSAKLPAPGGGAAAALVGALASSLNCMVGNFTAGKDKDASVSEEVKGLLKLSEKYREGLLNLMESDIEVYGNYSKASKLPKGTEAEKALREKAVEETVKKAAEVPYKVMIICGKILQVCESLLSKGNKNLLSDVGVAAFFAGAALKAAYLNVLVNFLYLKDESFRCKILKETKLLLSESGRIERLVEEECKKKLGG